MYTAGKRRCTLKWLVHPKMKMMSLITTLMLFQNLKGELWRKMNLWSNYTLVPSRPFSEICFHDNRM